MIKPPSLLVLQKFISSSLCNSLIEEFEKNPNKAKFQELDSSFNERVLSMRNITVPLIQDIGMLSLEIVDLLKHQFHEEKLYPETVSIVKWFPGQTMNLHRDGQNHHTKNRSHSVVVYLNTTISGGDIHFPELGAMIHPQEGLLVAYNKELLHLVTKVIDPRYTLTLWYTKDPQYSICSFEVE